MLGCGFLTRNVRLVHRISHPQVNRRHGVRQWRPSAVRPFLKTVYSVSPSDPMSWAPDDRGTPLAATYRDRPGLDGGLGHGIQGALYVPVS